MPTAIRVPKRLDAPAATIRIRHIITAYTMMTAAPPKNPNCSPTAVKMKSEVWAGMKLRRVWLPWNNPRPTSWPEPMAICDW